MSRRKVLAGATQLRKVAQAQLEQHLSVEHHDLLDAVAAREEIALAPIKTWRRLSDYLDLPEALSPALYVTTPGTDGEPVMYDRSSIRADWLVRVFVACRGRDYQETSDRRDAYLAAIRLALLADPSLDGYSGDGGQWVGDSYEEADTSDDNTARWLGVGSTTVRYLDVLTASRIDALPAQADPGAPTALTLQPGYTVRAAPVDVP